MDEHTQTETTGYNKVIKGCAFVAAAFFIMGWVLDQTAKHDEKIKAASTSTVSTQDSPPPESIQAPVKPKVVYYYYTPTELQNAFESNEVRITHKLAGNVLVLQGKISDIGLSFGKPVIGISVPDSYATIKVFFDESRANQISELNVGDVIKVGSNNVSLNPFGTIHIQKATLLSPNK